ncbi:GILT-like protein 1 [Galleria mellonella]|uniref:GILT-like protein 1 n=1 Tax=Galleria mellonella TaxID=7137 RepID=A0A6J1WXV5_GALME|nr:GILT-like protein 1 [Galleria mellonella]
MISKILFSVLLCTLVLGVTSEIEVIDGKIKITTLTTAGCVHTVNFISNQLAPTYALYEQYLDVEFLPWGRTIKYDNGTFYCQFSPNNCWANRLHRCVLNFLRDNQAAQVRYMDCEFSVPQPAFQNSSYSCVQNEGLSLIDVDYCVRNPDLDDLDAIAEEASRPAMDPETGINGLPAVVINGIIDIELSRQARANLRGLVCTALANSGVTNISISSCGN